MCKAFQRLPASLRVKASVMSMACKALPSRALSSSTSPHRGTLASVLFLQQMAMVPSQAPCPRQPLCLECFTLQALTVSSSLQISRISPYLKSVLPPSYRKEKPYHPQNTLYPIPALFFSIALLSLDVLCLLIISPLTHTHTHTHTGGTLSMFSKPVFPALGIMPST